MPYSGADDPKLPDNVKKLDAAKRKQWVGTFNSVFSNCRSASTPGGAGSVSVCEGRAFKFANGVVKAESAKELADLLIADGMDEDEALETATKAWKESKVLSTANATMLQQAMAMIQKVLKAAGLMDGDMEKALATVAAKCMDEAVAMPMKPYAGATSFEDIDLYLKAIGQEMAVHQTVNDLRTIVDNILSNDDLTMEEKSSGVEKAARDFRGRLTDAQAHAAEMGHTELDGDADDPGQGGIRGWLADLPGLRLGALGQKVIRKQGEKWVLFSKDGKDKLGEFDSEEDAKKREGQIQFFKRQGQKAATGVQFVIGRPKGKTTTDVQTVVFDKENWTVAKAKAWLKDHDMKAPEVEESENSLRFRQRPPGDFQDGSFKTITPGAKSVEDLLAHRQSAFLAFKDNGGAWRWAAVVSNQFRDREGEIFPSWAHKEYINHLDQTGEYPELWFWHIPGSRMGRAEFADYVDGFLVMGGTFDDRFKDVAQKLSEMPDLGVSHGFKFVRDVFDPSVISWYRTFEVSPLPAERAANAATAFLALKEGDMSLRPEVRAKVFELGGEELVRLWEDGLPVVGKQMKAAGIDFKEMAELLGYAEAPPTDPAPVLTAITPTAPPAPAPASDGGPVAAVLAAVQGVGKNVEAVASRLDGLEGRLGAMEGAVKDLKADDVTKIASLLTPAAAAAVTRRPSDDPANVIKDEDAQKALDEGKLPQAVEAIAPYIKDLLGSPA